MAGQLRVGTSGFSYPGWSPRFYPPGVTAPEFLPYYAARLDACELNNTFYRRPGASLVRAWVAATPADFRFCAKAQRGASLRAIGGDPGAVAWLSEPFRAFGDRLGSVLLRVPEAVRRDPSGASDTRLAALLAAWPPEIPLAADFQDPSWQVDEVFGLLAGAGAVLCATELPEDPDPPTIRVTGPFLYVRLRRHEYSDDALQAWAARLIPFLDAGHDVYAFFRHDESGRAPEFAAALRDAVIRGDASQRDFA